jgi:hypothetical protein
VIKFGLEEGEEGVWYGSRVVECGGGGDGIGKVGI